MNIVTFQVPLQSYSVDGIQSQVPIKKSSQTKSLRAVTYLIYKNLPKTFYCRASKCAAVLASSAAIMLGGITEAVTP